MPDKDSLICEESTCRRIFRCLKLVLWLAVNASSDLFLPVYIAAVVFQPMKMFVMITLMTAKTNLLDLVQTELSPTR